MFDQGKESFDNAVEQLQKERNDNSEILQQHNALKEENKNLRVLIDKLNERLDAQDNKINATNEHIERLEHEIDVKNNSSDEDIVFIKREIVS
jgi:seryl-tRNA synthetase